MSAVIAARRGGSDQGGFTLIETMLSVILAALIMLPLLGWALVAMREQANTVNRNTDGASVGLLRSYFVRDVASAHRGDVGTVAEGTDCTGGDGAAASDTDTLLRLRGDGDTAIVYNQAGSSGGSGTSIWRRECNGTTLVWSSELVTRVNAGTPVISCLPRIAGGTDCTKVSLRLETLDSAVVSMTASLRAGAVSGSSGPGAPQYVSPDVLIGVDPIEARRGETVTFDGSGTVDPRGGELSYRWEFGNGSTSTDAEATTTYSSLGEFTAVFTATNSNGTPSSDFVRIKVVNRIPTAVISAPSDAVTTTYRCTNVSFAGVGSNDSGDAPYGGSVASYNWTYGDGGTHTATSASAHTRQYTQLSPDGGTTPFSVGLSVTDNDGGTSPTATQQIKVVNRPPTVSITGNGLSGNLGGTKPVTVNFVANANDADGACDSLTYAWTFGDGATSTEKNPSHTYTTGSQHTARVKVTDNTGAEVTSNAITVTLNTTPTAAFALGVNSVRTGVPVAITNQSTDAETATNQLGHAWSFPNGAPSASTSATPGTVTFTHNVGTADTFISAVYTVGLTVTDPSGSVHSTTKNITVTGAPAPGNLRKTGANCQRSNFLGCQERYIDFAWNAVSNVATTDSYQLHVRCTTTFCGDDLTRTFTSTSTRFAGLSQGFLGTTLTYDARIRARDAHTGKWGPWSPTISVTSRP